MKSPVAYFRWGFSYSYSSICSRSIPAVPRQPILPACCLIGICYRYVGRVSFRHSGCDRPHRIAIAHTRLQTVGINVTGYVCIQFGDRLHIRTTQRVFENLIALNIACGRLIPG